MAKYRAIAKGYYGDVIRDPDGPHAVFEGPDDLEGSWLERIDDNTPVKAPEPVAEETLEAEAILDTEADVNAEAGVETL